MYNILASGSKGNAVIIADRILIDCGVAYKTLKPFVKDLSLVLLTHIHSDHFNKRTIRKLAEERPGLLWMCGPWLASDLHDCGVSYIQIRAFVYGNKYHFVGHLCSKPMWVEPFRLVHDVPNCGYKMEVNGKKLIYATDTSRLDTDATGIDLFLIEANYTENELQERINRKLEAGEDYIYDMKVRDNHLSRETATDFYMKYSSPNSELIFLHVHQDREPICDELPDAQATEGVMDV